MVHSERSKKAAVAADLQAIAGVDKYFSTVASVTLEGEPLTPAQMKAVFQAEIDALQAADQGHAVYTGLLDKAVGARAKALALRRALRTYVRVTFGASAKTMLADFSALPKQPSTLVTTKAQAQVKAKATRDARHTKGPKQKQAIKGQVPETPATPKPSV